MATRPGVVAGAEAGEAAAVITTAAVDAVAVVAAMAIGYGLGRFTDGARRRSIIIEVGFQNGTFGIVLATTQLDSATAALSPAFYSLVMFATGGTLAWVWSRRSSAPSPAPTSA